LEGAGFTYDNERWVLRNVDLRITRGEKIAITRKYREARYQSLCDAVYKRRGWTPNGVPTVARLKELGIDWPELVAIVTRHGG